MALAKKSSIHALPASSHLRDDRPLQVGKSHLVAEAEKRKARTFARQQKAAERIASATTQLASGIAEAASAADELRKALRTDRRRCRGGCGRGQQSHEGGQRGRHPDPVRQG